MIIQVSSISQLLLFPCFLLLLLDLDYEALLLLPKLQLHSQIRKIISDCTRITNVYILVGKLYYKFMPPLSFSPS